jgi:formamidopyrimidine-DNA glycosylase
MPELPEVETVARRLAAEAGGRRIADVVVLDDKQDAAALARLPGHRIGDVQRLGKQCVLHLVRPRRRQADRYLAVHLRMTGQLYWAAHLPADLRHLRVRLDLDRGHILFADLRRFGRLRVVEDLAALAPAGLDPTTDAFTVTALGRLLAGSRQPLKPWLLRQDRLVGLGNIYASEILFAAGLRPDRPAGSLDAAERRRLHRATRRVLQGAIDAAGTTFYAIEAGRRLHGTFREQLAVYGQEGATCPRCGGPVRRIVQAQRSTYFCATCQQ